MIWPYGFSLRFAPHRIRNASSRWRFRKIALRESSFGLTGCCALHQLPPGGARLAAGRLATPCRFGRVLAAHRRRAFALAARADMGLAFRLLLVSFALRFFLFGPRVAALALLRTVKFRSARFVQR